MLATGRNVVADALQTNSPRCLIFGSLDIDVATTVAANVTAMFETDSAVETAATTAEETSLTPMDVCALGLDHRIFLWLSVIRFGCSNHH